MDFLAAGAAAALRAGAARVADFFAVGALAGRAACLAFGSGAGLGARTGRPSHMGRSPSARGTGFCAWCGCSAPSYTWSLLAMARPSRFFGSMPFTAFSTTKRGRFSSRRAYGVSVSPPG